MNLSSIDPVCGSFAQCVDFGSVQLFIHTGLVGCHFSLKNLKPFLLLPGRRCRTFASAVGALL